MEGCPWEEAEQGRLGGKKEYKYNGVSSNTKGQLRMEIYFCGWGRALGKDMASGGKVVSMKCRDSRRANATILREGLKSVQKGWGLGKGGSYSIFQQEMGEKAQRGSKVLGGPIIGDTI